MFNGKQKVFLTNLAGFALLVLLISPFFLRPSSSSVSPSVAVAAAAVSTASPTPEPTIERVVGFAKQNANLRSGPGMQYAVVGGVSAGEMLFLIAIDSKREWLQLDSEKWIAAWLVSSSPVALGPAPAPARTPTTQPASRNCEPAYPTICIPPGIPDLDCPDMRAQGFSNFRVNPPDPHRFDADHDGVGCEG